MYEIGTVFEKDFTINSYTMKDRFHIYNQNENEVLELAKRLRYPVDAILSAVQEVGFNEDEIEEYIRDREERSLF